MLGARLQIWRADSCVGTLTGQKTGDEDLNKLQDDVGEGVGGLVGKGGIAESAGQIVSEGL